MAIQETMFEQLASLACISHRHGVCSKKKGNLKYKKIYEKFAG